MAAGSSPQIQLLAQAATPSGYEVLTGCSNHPTFSRSRSAAATHGRPWSPTSQAQGSRRPCVAWEIVGDCGETPASLHRADRDGAMSDILNADLTQSSAEDDRDDSPNIGSRQGRLPAQCALRSCRCILRSASELLSSTAEEGIDTSAHPVRSQLAQYNDGRWQRWASQDRSASCDVWPC